MIKVRQSVLGFAGAIALTDLGALVFGNILPWALSVYVAPFALLQVAFRWTQTLGIVVGLLAVGPLRWLTPISSLLVMNVLTTMTMAMASVILWGAHAGHVSAFVVGMALFGTQLLYASARGPNRLARASVLRQFMTPDEQTGFVRFKEFEQSVWRVLGGTALLTFSVQAHWIAISSTVTLVAFSLFLVYLRGLEGKALMKHQTYLTPLGGLSEVGEALGAERVSCLQLVYSLGSAGFCAVIFLPQLIQQRFGGGEEMFATLVVVLGAGALAGNILPQVQSDRGLYLSEVAALLSVGLLFFIDGRTAVAACVFFGQLCSQRCEVYFKREIQAMEGASGEAARLTAEWFSPLPRMSWLIPGILIDFSVPIDSVLLLWSTAAALAITCAYRQHCKH